MSEKPEILNPREGGWFRQGLRWLLFGFTAMGLVGAAVGVWVYVDYSEKLPALPDLDVVPPREVGVIQSPDGYVLGRYSKTWREPLAYEQIPRTLLLAFLSTEDSRFFSHPGVDFMGIVRAAIRNLKAGGVVQGGSTITQQLAKSLLSTEKTLDRKIKEALLSFQIEARYSKEEILLLYLNSIYLGNQAHGIQAAAKHYFHRPVWDLTLAEMALLAGLPQAPSRLDPTRNPEAALQRRAIVLDRMVSKGFISAAQARDAKDEPIRARKRRRFRDSTAPFCADEARKFAIQEFGKEWMEAGLQIESTCDPILTSRAQKALQHGLEALDRRQGWRGPLEKKVTGSRREKLKALGRAAGSIRSGEQVVGIVAAVEKTKATVEVGEGELGTILLEHHQWMGKYKAFPVVKTRDGRSVVNRSGAVSLDPKCKDLRDALEPGDAVMLSMDDRDEEGMWRARIEQVPRVEGAFLSVDRTTGDARAIVGSYDYRRNEVNRVHSIRQTGSLMKPVMYARAYDMGLAPSALFSGAPFHEGNYNPTGKKAASDMTAWEGLAKSMNAISLRLHQFVLQTGSLDAYKAWGRQLGLSQPLEGYPSEVLGTEQSLWDMTRAFFVFSEAGRRKEVRTVRSVRDSQGNLLRDFRDPQDEGNNPLETLDILLSKPIEDPFPALAPEASYLIAANLQEVTRSGTAKKASRTLPFQTAGKTGTLPYDVWFVGWSPEFLSGVWVGADVRDRVLGYSEKRNKVHGGNTALPIWLEWMAQSVTDAPERPLHPAAPTGIEFPTIDLTTGLLALQGGVQIPHRAGTIPTGMASEAPEEPESPLPAARETYSAEVPVQSVPSVPRIVPGAEQEPKPGEAPPNPRQTPPLGASESPDSPSGQEPEKSPSLDAILDL